ncbi:MAG: hypothetical protein CL844_05180 [Crocinitomicaceae bacterium]|nr:hypothetical protein [Crocinitomicaceae bacterium]|tara:strand:+ start:166 stop:375 length:210 start_codon:yes stop_codon:yes gene_type:complete
MQTEKLTRKQKQHIRAAFAHYAVWEIVGDSLRRDWEEQGLDPDSFALQNYARDVEDRITKFLGDPRYVW